MRMVSTMSVVGNDAFLIDLGHLDRFWLGITLTADQGVCDDDHLWNIALADIGGNGIGQCPKMLATDRPTAEFTNALSGPSTYAAFHVGASVDIGFPLRAGPHQLLCDLGDAVREIVVRIADAENARAGQGYDVF